MTDQDTPDDQNHLRDESSTDGADSDPAAHEAEPLTSGRRKYLQLCAALGVGVPSVGAASASSDESQNSKRNGPPGIRPEYDVSGARRRYVAPDGDADADGRRSDPWSAEAAFSEAEPGDHVIFLPGEYDGTFIIETSGTADQPITYEAETRHQVVFTGHPEYGNTVTLQVNEVSHVRLTGFKFDTGENQWLNVQDSEDVLLHSLWLTGHTGVSAPSRLNGNDGLTLKNCIARHNPHFDNLRVYDNDHFVMENCFVGLGNHTPFGMYHTGDTRESENVDCALRGNVFAGVTSRGGAIQRAERVLFEDNLYTNGFQGPGSGTSASKFLVDHGIFRFNRFYDLHGSQGLSLSTYSEVNFSLGTRMYNSIIDSTRAKPFRNDGGLKVSHSGGQERFSDTQLINSVLSRNSHEDAFAKDVQFWFGFEDTDFHFDHTAFWAEGRTPNMQLRDPEGEDFSGPPMPIEDFAEKIPDRWRENLVDVDPGYLDPDTFDFRLREDSELREAGRHLAHATEAGSGDTIPVSDANPFYDGYGIEGERGDVIAVGEDKQRARIEEAHPEADELVIDRELSWEKDDPVSLPWGGDAPDIGVYEYGPGARPQVRVNAPRSAHAGEEVEMSVNLVGIDGANRIDWEFGDGGPKGGRGRTVTHTYDELGDYAVRVRVIDRHGNEHHGAHYVLVSNDEIDATSLEYNKEMLSRLLCGGGEVVENTESYGQWECKSHDDEEEYDSIEDENAPSGLEVTSTEELVEDFETELDEWAGEAYDRVDEEPFEGDWHAQRMSSSWSYMQSSEGLGRYPELGDRFVYYASAPADSAIRFQFAVQADQVDLPNRENLYHLDYNTRSDEDTLRVRRRVDGAESTLASRKPPEVTDDYAKFEVNWYRRDDDAIVIWWRVYESDDADGWTLAGEVYAVDESASFTGGGIGLASYDEGPTRADHVHVSGAIEGEVDSDQ